ncbi:prefoldin subunit 6-like [Amphiura filiformis]|uniref:prefoldin subunit 6-like n=1 Tax=Amphiura filiformis TaxID=82378 RepID=UPI003B226DE2
MATDTAQKKLQGELEKFKAVQKDYQKALAARQQLDAQLSENNIVKSELEELETEAQVYKMMGPVLIKQDVDEAKQTVKKRIEYITGELKRQETNIKDLEKQQDSYREKLSKLQQELQKAQMKQIGVKS